jgi:hypothetical protein
MGIEGNSEHFKKMAAEMRDSVKAFIKKKPLLPSTMVQDEWKLRLHACLLDKEMDFLSRFIKLQDTLHRYKGPLDADHCMKALKNYIKYSDATYFNYFVDTLSRKRELNQFKENYPRLAILAEALRALHDTKDNYKRASKNAFTRSRNIEDAQHCYALFKLRVTKTLPELQLKLSKEHKMKENKLWKKHHCNINNIISGLNRACQLIDQCQTMLANADDLKQKAAWVRASSLYMDVLRNDDVLELLEHMRNANLTSANCGNFKHLAYAQVKELKDKRRKLYNDSLEVIAQRLHHAKNTNDFLDIADSYAQVNRLNNGLSIAPVLKMQAIYLKLGDNLTECKDTSEAEKYYLQGINLEKTQYTDLFKQKLTEIAERKWKCRMRVDPNAKRPAVNLDSIPIVTERDRKYIINDIRNILYQNIEGNPNGREFINKDIIILDNPYRYSIDTDTSGVMSVLSELDFPLGYAIGDEYAEQQRVEKMIMAVAKAYQKHHKSIVMIKITSVGSADNTPFRDKQICIPEVEDYSGKQQVFPCYTNDTLLLGGLMCGNSDQKNLALAYLRAYRREQLIRAFFEESKTVIPIQYNSCGQVSPEKGAKYRYVNTTYEFILK